MTFDLTLRQKFVSHGNLIFFENFAEMKSRCSKDKTWCVQSQDSFKSGVRFEFIDQNDESMVAVPTYCTSYLRTVHMI